MAQVLRPFMLRRLKESVAKELPQKREHLLSGGLGLLPRCVHSAMHGGGARCISCLCVCQERSSLIADAALLHVCLRTRLLAVLPSPYQRALFQLMQQELQRGGGGSGALRGVNNVAMECRNICNHPLIRWVGGLAGWVVWLDPLLHRQYCCN